VCSTHEVGNLPAVACQVVRTRFAMVAVTNTSMGPLLARRRRIRRGPQNALRELVPLAIATRGRPEQVRGTWSHHPHRQSELPVRITIIIAVRQGCARGPEATVVAGRPVRPAAKVLPLAADHQRQEI